MALLKTPQRDNAFKLTDFHLIGTDDKMYDARDIKGANGTALFFICNHCPYVLAMIDRIVADAHVLMANNIGCAAICSNDATAYPDDSFANMKKFDTQHMLTDLPYLWDESQDVAKAYGAVCTPDIFGFDKDDSLVYRGRLDNAGAQSDINSADFHRDFLNTMLQIKDHGSSDIAQHPSMGCSIKWK